MGARSEFKIRNLKFQMDGDGKGEKRTKARGKFAASGGRCASSGDPVLSHWANLCRAYGAETKTENTHPSQRRRRMGTP